MVYLCKFFASCLKYLINLRFDRSKYVMAHLQSNIDQAHIDNLHLLSFLKWYRKYGEVYTYWISELPIVAICGHEKMIETFQKDGEAYAGRFTFDEFNRITRGKLCHWAKLLYPNLCTQRI